MTLFNKSRYLPESIDSILGQSHSDFGLVAIDNASSDNTEAIMETYVDKDSRIHYIKNPTNIGLIQNWKKAFTTALNLYPKMQYFAWASDHDIWDKNWLSKHLDALDTNSNASLAYPITIPIDENGEKISVSLPKYENIHMTKYNRMVSVSTQMKGVGNMIYGLFRTQSILKAGIHPYCIMPDRSMLLEIALNGSFLQIKEPLWRRRYFNANYSQEHLSINYQDFLVRQRSTYFNGKAPIHTYFPTAWHALRIILRTLFNPKYGLHDSLLGTIGGLLLLKRRRRELQKEISYTLGMIIDKLKP